LRLDRKDERRHRLVADDEIGAEDQRARCRFAEAWSKAAWAPAPRPNKSLARWSVASALTAKASAHFTAASATSMVEACGSKRDLDCFHWAFACSTAAEARSSAAA
jgi:hypothetical protein